jgi:hypothetical protein
LAQVAQTMRWSVVVALAMGDGVANPLQARLEAARSQTEALKEEVTAVRRRAAALRLQYAFSRGHAPSIRDYWHGYPYELTLEQAGPEAGLRWALTYQARTFHFRLDELGMTERTMREGVEGFLHFLARR